jgi:predicted nucleic acid-binding protein
VLTRPLQLAAMRLTIGDVRNALAALATVAEQVLIHYLWRPVLKDPSDEHVLDAAMNGRANFLVTFNQADFVDASRTFEIDVVTPSEALGKLRKQ